MRRTYRSLSRLAAVLSLTVAACVTAAAQDRGRIRLESLDALGAKAAEAVNVNIDGVLIRFAGGFMSEEDADEKEVKELISGLRGVYVRSYEFKSAGQYADSDLAQIRSQVSGPGWSRVMSFRGRGDDFSDAEFYVAREGDRVDGLVVIAAKPNEVTVVNIVGSVDLEKLQRLADNVHPRRDRQGKGKTTKKP